MDNLTMDLIKLTRRNRDGAYGTQKNRQRGLTAIAGELRDLGYKLPAAHSLKTKHVSALVEHWQCRELDAATIRNRLTWLRWWAEKIDKANVVERDNRAYGVGLKAEQQRNRAFSLPTVKLAQIDCPYIRASLRLQAAFGLRREEALKFQPRYAVRPDRIILKGSWAKGGRARQIPLTTPQQRAALLEVGRLILGEGSLIPHRLSYVEQLKRYEHQTLNAGLRNTHGLRHHYAQQRYLALTGQRCPLAGGKRWAELSARERKLDIHARRQIALELGHGRLAITNIYLGECMPMKRAEATYHLTAKARQRYAERLFDLNRVGTAIERRASEGYRDMRVYQAFPFDLRDLPPAKRLEAWLDDNHFTYAWCPTPQLVDSFRPMRQDDYPELVVRW